MRVRLISRRRCLAGVAAVIASLTAAQAQPAPVPVPPAPAPAAPDAAPAPAPAPTPPASQTPPDSVLAEQVAATLVARAQELYAEQVFADAKQLAVEAMVKSPRGPAAEQARALIKQINAQLGIADEPVDPPAEATPPPPADTPIEAPPKAEQPPEAPSRANRITARVHSGLYAGLLGATVGSWFDGDSPSVALPLGVAGGLAGAMYLPRLIDKLDWHEAQIRTMGAGTVWGGVIGGLFADAVKTNGTTARHVLGGSSIGATLGGLGGALLARSDKLTRGDVALVDTLAGIGTFGGFTIGMLMQPAESEAYSVNAILGTAGGVLVGLIAAPQTNTTPRRMARVAGAAALGGGVPFLLYAAIRDSGTSADERVTGALSTVGLVAGAWIGFRLTRHLDRDLDVLPGRAPKDDDDDAPLALIGRHSDGRWGLNGLTVQPLSRALAPEPGMAVPVLGAAW